MKFLVSGAGGDIAQAIIKILRETSVDSEIVGTDARVSNVDTTTIDEFIQCPPARNSGQYSAWMKDLFEKENFDYFFPLSEDELRHLAELDQRTLNELEERTKIVWAGKKIVNLFLSKYKTYEFLLSIGQKPPKTLLYSQNMRISDFPVIVKPNYGRGSRNIFLCSTQSELDAASAFTDGPVVQEYIPSEESEYTCGVFQKDDVLRVIILRRYLSGGTTSWAEVVEDNEISKACSQVAEALQLDGSINIQLRKSGSRVAIFEINPRFSSTVLMRHKIGFEDVLWSLGFNGSREFNTLNPVGKRLITTRDVRVV
jgi:carbamoyl-phosphate synthase large subunit